MWVDLYGRTCGLRDSTAASVSDLRPVLEPARRIFLPRAVRADETSEGCLNRSRREPGITSGAGATTLLEGSQQSRLWQRYRKHDHGARCLIACSTVKAGEWHSSQPNEAWTVLDSRWPMTSSRCGSNVNRKGRRSCSDWRSSVVTAEWFSPMEIRVDYASGLSHFLSLPLSQEY